MDYIKPDYKICDMMKLIMGNNVMHAWHYFGPWMLFLTSCDLCKILISSHVSNQNGVSQSWGLHSWLRGLQLNILQHPRARRKSFLTLKTVSALWALRHDWLYCTLAYCTHNSPQFLSSFCWFHSSAVHFLHIIYEFLTLCAHVAGVVVRSEPCT